MERDGEIKRERKGERGRAHARERARKREQPRTCALTHLTTGPRKRMTCAQTPDQRLRIGKDRRQAHSNMHARTHNTHITNAHTHTHTETHTHTHTHTIARAHTHNRTQSRAHTHTHTHTHSPALPNTFTLTPSRSLLPLYSLPHSLSTPCLSPSLPLLSSSVAGKCLDPRGPGYFHQRGSAEISPGGYALFLFICLFFPKRGAAEVSPAEYAFICFVRLFFFALKENSKNQNSMILH
jgi:hypothetical protein